ncbi:MAG TPA: bacteriohemerythrin [Terriglobales bacterium]|nr:bacteriohemerythrin [Terriglobales bacterium]
MPLMSWENRYSVHLPNIDAQHKKLFDLINQLHDAMGQGRANEVMGKILTELVAYTKTHFQAEEALLKSKNYPDLAAHQQQHRKFTDQVMQFEKDFSEGRATISIKMMNFLRDWLTQHILQTDQRYSAFLQAKGQAAS